MVTARRTAPPTAGEAENAVGTIVVVVGVAEEVGEGMEMATHRVGAVGMEVRRSQSVRLQRS